MEDDGRLEIRAPKTYDAKCPAVFFSHDLSSSQISIEDHHLARDLPKATPEPSVQRGADDFRSFAARPDIPTDVNDMVQQNLPLISLHITSFNDATLVGLAWPHVMMDAFGIKALLSSWSLVLSGEEDKVPAVLGARHDGKQMFVSSLPTLRGRTVESYNTYSRKRTSRKEVIPSPMKRDETQLGFRDRIVI